MLPLSLFIFSPAQTNDPPRNQLEREISLTEKLLEETQSKEKKALSSLQLLNRQIDLRKRLIRQNGQAIKDEERKIEDLGGIIEQLEEDVQGMSFEYGRLAQLTQQSQASQNFWLLLLSSKSFSEAYYRAIYFKQFSLHRKRQIQAISKTRTYLHDKTDQLEQSIELNKELIVKHQQENDKLSSQIDEQGLLYADLKKRANVINEQLQLRKQRLKGLIKEDENTFLLAAENIDNSYAANFRKRKGLLTWPVPPAQAIITEHFGESEDEFGNRIFNDGMYMATSQGQPVKAVYSGKVTAVSRLPMSGTVVILEHGKYRTVYANLVNTYVKKGDVVSENQILGSVRQDPRSGENMFNFLIYLIPDKFLNPEDWLLDE